MCMNIHHFWSLFLYLSSQQNKCDFSMCKSYCAAPSSQRTSFTTDGCCSAAGTHPKWLVWNEGKVWNWRLFLPPFTRYTRVSKELPVWKYSFQFNGYICRRIFWVSACETDVKAETGIKRLSFTRKQAKKSKLQRVWFLISFKTSTGDLGHRKQLVPKVDRG